MSKNLVVIAVAFFLALASIQVAIAQNSTEMETFYSQKLGVVTVGFEAAREILPRGNMTVHLSLNCRAMDVNIINLGFSVYGFRSGSEKTLLDSKTVIEDEGLSFNETRTYNLTVPIPTDVWGVTHTVLYLDYTVPSMSVPVFEPGFSTTIVRNTYLEELEKMFEILNQTYQELNETYWESFQNDLTNDNLISLNQTYWELKQNITSFRRNRSELENTRTVTVILGITTVFFVATTIYLIWRKPKEYW